MAWFRCSLIGVTMLSKSFFTNENTLFAGSVTVAFLASAALFEYDRRAVSNVVSVGTMLVYGTNPENNGQGFTGDAQDRVTAIFACPSITEDQALESKAYTAIAVCRAQEKHSLFFGPSLREIIEQEMPLAHLPGQGWSYGVPRVPANEMLHDLTIQAG
jgi:hypothetical protein